MTDGDVLLYIPPSDWELWTKLDCKAMRSQGSRKVPLGLVLSLPSLRISILRLST
jgi:hypothetical protein